MKLILSCLLLCPFSGYFCLCQVPYFQHTYLLRKNDQVAVNAMLQDRVGFLWFATSKGLFKFDGSVTRHFTSADSLPHEHVTALAVDSLGRLWSGHENGNLAYLEKGMFHKFDVPEGLSSNEISDILFDGAGNLWFSTLNDGLYYFTHQRLYRLDKDDGLPDLFIYDLAVDAEGRIWVGTDGGAVRCTLKETSVEVEVFDKRNGLTDPIVKKIAVDKGGQVWLGTEDAGIFIFEPASAKIRQAMKWDFGAITDFSLTENEVWISSLQTGLIVYDRLRGGSKLFDAKSGPGFTAINHLFRDHEGNVWASTKTDIMRTRGDELEFIERFDPAKDFNALAVTTDHSGAIWFSTNEGLFKRTVDKSGRIAIQQPLNATPYRHYTTVSLYTDHAGFVWAGLYGEGVLRIHPENYSIRYINRELRNGNVLHITGHADVIWLATLGGGTQIRISGDPFNIRNFTSTEGLISDYIYQVFIDSQDRVWFGTDGKGVDMLDRQGLHHYQAGLNSKVVYGFAEDGLKRIWVNTQGDGLYVLKDDRFHAFDSSATRIRNNNIGCFTSTPNGNLFIMHESGIDLYDVRTNKIRYLGEESGIRDVEPNLNAFSKDGNGAIYIGTDGGLIKYTENNTRDAEGPAPVIRGLTVMNREIELTPSLTLNYNQNDVTIRYTGLWFQNPSAISYQYRLQNFDREWISSQDNSATYSSLAPGTYVFSVKASDTRDFSAAGETSIAFTIRPPFWQTAWFYGVSTAGVIFLIYSLIQYRERRLRSDKQVLEMNVAERTLEVIKKNAEIHAQAEEIRAINENLEGLVKERTRELERKNKALEEYAFINAHELRAPVASILGLINLMQTVEKDEDEKLYLEHLKTSAERLDDVVRSIGKAIEKGG